MKSEPLIIEPLPANDMRGLDPVHELPDEDAVGRWTRRLVLFLRVMAGVAMIKGLYHWARVCGIIGAPDAQFEYHSVAWQAATIFFAVIDLVAAVGLWLAAAWGAVIWLTSIASMLAVQVFFPQVFEGSLLVGLVEGCLLAMYLWLALKSAQEHVP